MPQELPPALATALQDLGQNVFNPPSVKGWDGGPNWLNGQTLLFRQNLQRACVDADLRVPPAQRIAHPRL